MKTLVLTSLVFLGVVTIYANSKNLNRFMIDTTGGHKVESGELSVIKSHLNIFL